jgi:hypothetical protein
MAEKSSYEERMTEDLGLKMLSEEDMQCAKCKHKEGEVLSCGIYAQKPDDVVDGKDCPRFEEG